MGLRYKLPLSSTYDPNRKNEYDLDIFSFVLEIKIIKMQSFKAIFVSKSVLSQPDRNFI